MPLIACGSCGKEKRTIDPTCWSCGAADVRVDPNAKPPTPALVKHAPPPVRCPKCGSDQISANQQGYGWVKGLIGGAVAPRGLLAGFIGSRKVIVTCLNCGKQWKP